tara:strand:+ start:58043 stop:58333 length:291 start_codon:yes stop_codon:yes gene_type:complete
MPFSKSFPRTIPGSNYPVWQEIFLTAEEEKAVEDACRKINFSLLDACLQDAKSLAIKNAINTEENITNLAIALFEKRASHVVFWKENKAKEKFEQK